MCALAGLPARAAARLRALEAGAPALAAGATGRLQLDDLMEPGSFVYLLPLIVPSLFPVDQAERALTLREARFMYDGAAAAVAGTLAGILRRIDWRALLPGPGRAPRPRCTTEPEAALAMLGQVTCLFQTLSALLTSPFRVREGPDRATATREAARRCAPCVRTPARAPAAPRAQALLAPAGLRGTTCSAWPPTWPPRGQTWRRAAPRSSRARWPATWSPTARPGCSGCGPARPPRRPPRAREPRPAARRAGGRGLVAGGRVGGVGRGRHAAGRRAGAVPRRHLRAAAAPGHHAGAAAAAPARLERRVLGPAQVPARREHAGAPGAAPRPAASPAPSARRADARGPPQHLRWAARLYEELDAAGAAPHAAYARAFGEAAASSLLVHVMEQGLVGGCGARPARPPRRGAHWGKAPTPSAAAQAAPAARPATGKQTWTRCTAA